MSGLLWQSKSSVTTAISQPLNQLCSFPVRSSDPRNASPLRTVPRTLQLCAGYTLQSHPHISNMQIRYRQGSRLRHPIPLALHTQQRRPCHRLLLTLQTPDS